MRPLSDRDLPSPFQAWIDRSTPLPPGVKLLPRTIDVFGDALALLTIGSVCLVMAGLLIGAVTSWLRSLPDTRGLAFLLPSLAILLGVPIWMARRLWRTMSASRDQKAGTLRQGILIGPDGLLVRLLPNACYAIPLDRFITASKWTGGGADGSDYLRIETHDGPLDLADEHLTFGAAEVNEAVLAVRPWPRSR